MKVHLTGDELVLALMGLVRRVNPAMLVPDQDGFAVDFTALASKQSLTADEQLLVKLRVASEGGGPSVDLDAAEAQLLATALEGLEALQNWPADVAEMSRALRARLAPRV